MEDIVHVNCIWQYTDKGKFFCKRQANENKKNSHTRQEEDKISEI